MQILTAQLEMFMRSKMDIHSSNQMSMDEFDLIITLYEERLKEQNRKS